MNSLNPVLADRPATGAPANFELVSDFEPAGDQPTAIAEIIGGLNNEERDQVLLGVTGSGKTFTMAKAIQALGTASPDPGTQQDARGAALWRDEKLLPE